MAAATTTGRLITRTGPLPRLPAASAAGCILTALLLLTQLDAGSSSRPRSRGTLVVLGLGMGMTFQPYVIATQNAVEPANLGIATASVQFFRSMGGSVAVAALGALLANRLAVELTAATRRGRRRGSTRTGC